MKCAIFCLLVFCAFETVFADDSADEQGLSNCQTDSRIGDISRKLLSDIGAAVDAAKIQKINHDDVMFKCWIGQSYPGFSQGLDTKGSSCMLCYDKYQTNIKSAKHCSNKIVIEAKKASKSVLPLVNKCITKCAQSEDNCLKEIIKQKKDLGME